MQTVGQPLDAKSVQHIVLPFAGLPVAVFRFSEAQSLALAVGYLADIGRAVIGVDPLRILERGDGGAGRDDLRLARHRARRIDRFLDLVGHRPRLECGALRLVDQRFLSHGSRSERRCWRGCCRGRGCRRWCWRRLWRGRRRCWSGGGLLLLLWRGGRRGRRCRCLCFAQFRRKAPHREAGQRDDEQHADRDREAAAPADRRRERWQALILVALNSTEPRRRGQCGRGGHPLGRRVVGEGQRHAEHGAPFLDGLRALVGRESERLVDRGQERLVEAVSLRLGERPVGIAMHPAGRFRRRLAGDREMEDGAGGIDVAPRTMLAVECILLDRRILRRQHTGQRARAPADRLTRRTEIDQDRHAVAADDHVARLDVAMQEALRVHRAQPAQQSLGKAAHVVRRQAGAVLAQQLGDALAVLELHDGIGRAVGLEKAQHRHDVRMAEARQRPRLVEEALAAPGEVVGKAAAARHDLAPAAHGELDRQVFLDRHHLGELAVEGAIGDAEAAMADHRVEPIVAELETERQGLIVFDTHEGARMRPLYHRALPLIVVVCRRVAASWIWGTS